MHVLTDRCTHARRTPGHDISPLVVGQNVNRRHTCTLIDRGRESLTLSHKNPGFTCLQYKSFENIVGKGEIAHKEAVTPCRSGQRFLTFKETSVVAHDRWDRVRRAFSEHL